MDERPQAFWSVPSFELLQKLQTTPEGLTGEDAQKQLKRYGSNLLKPKKRSDSTTLFLAQFKSPIILILIFAAGLSFFLEDHTNTIIIMAIVLASGLLGFWQERGAANAVEKLIAIVRIKAEVYRDGKPGEIPVEDVVPGDVVILNAGDVIPCDCIILESKDLFADESTLTGETYPVDKTAGVLATETQLSKRTNSLFMGTHVVSGTAKALAVYTGRETEFGKVSGQLGLKPPETEFEHGVKHFGYLLMEVTLLLVIAIFAINVYLERPILDAFLFSLALAVGLTPQLLPAIISINLAHGAKRMADEKVIVKRLESIENFGSMNVLCSDKTGTLTEGIVSLHSAVGVEGTASGKVLLYAYLNAFYETGFTNPIDKAIRTHDRFDVSGYGKLDEIPYDFIRKRLSILVSTPKDETRLMITKGAFRNVLDACSHAETADGKTVDVDSVRQQIQAQFDDFGSRGFRMLGVAYKNIGSESLITKSHESGMTFLGFIILFDPPKKDIPKTINRLRHFGVSLKIITGDSLLVAENISRQTGLSTPHILTGHDLREMSDAALVKKVSTVNVFAEVEPNQKERIILALKKAGNVVGYMGDGINDASALHAADVGISVDGAVDVAKEAADIVLLEKDFGVLVEGIREGRTTFANTLKYVFMATSANFGNMFSMAGASLFLSFLPLLPKQILLMNLITDLPEMTIATDRVDDEMIRKPHRWDIKFIRKFMLTFGLLSSVFDYLTFGVLLLVLNATMDQFRTGWFIESVISASMIVLVIRTRKPFFRSMPGKYLLTTTLLVAAITLLFPFTPLAPLFGFQPLPAPFILMLIVLMALYIGLAEVMKMFFYRQVKF